VSKPVKLLIEGLEPPSNVTRRTRDSKPVQWKTKGNPVSKECTSRMLLRQLERGIFPMRAKKKKRKIGPS